MQYYNYFRVVIIIILWSRRFQAFSKHIDFWQGWLFLLQPSHFHHTLTHVECRQSERFVDVQVTFCHVMVCREHTFCTEVLSLGAEEYAQEVLAGAF